MTWENFKGSLIQVQDQPVCVTIKHKDGKVREPLMVRDLARLVKKSMDMKSLES